MIEYPEEKLSEDDDDGTMPENVAALRDSVVGHKIVSVQKDVPVARHWRTNARGTLITLDNGRQVVLADSDDCCAYTAMESFLLHPEMVDHVIMGVGTTEEYTKWHIYADYGDILELTIGWSCGNPFYYGYGFDILVVDNV